LDLERVQILLPYSVARADGCLQDPTVLVLWVQDAGCGVLPRHGRRMECVMSMRPRPWPDVPEQTAQVAKAAFPTGCLAMRVRDELGPLFADAEFVAAFGYGTGRGSRGSAGVGDGAAVRREPALLH